MAKKSPVLSALAYAVILLFWLAVLCAALYIPSISHRWGSKKSINILAWGSIFDAAVLSEFQKKTGIRINISYFTTNEELLVYLKATNGKGYDLIVPSDYAVSQLVREKLIKKIDPTKLTFLKDVNPNLMGHNFDPRNEYSLPYNVEVFGLGYDRTFFKNGLPNVSWDLIFKPENYKIAMVNDPVEAVMFAALYLYGPQHIEGMWAEAVQIKAIKELLIKQRPYVEVYSAFRPDYFLLTKHVPLVVTSYSNFERSKSSSNDIEFALPHEGIFLSIENLAISAGSTKDDLIYEFINHMYYSDVLKHHFNTIAAIPATMESLNSISLDDQVKSLLTSSREEFIARTVFFAPIMPEIALHDLWIAVKSQ